MEDSILKITDYEGASKEDLEKLEQLPVLLKQCYQQIYKAIEKYMDIDEKEINKIALWVIGACAIHNLVPSFPYLFINASKGSGKSRLLKLLAYLCKGRYVVRPTETVLFRTQDPLFIDEFEQVGKKETKDIRELLNAAYKNGATVPRAVKVEEIIDGKKTSIWKIIDYQVYRPIAMANIWGMDEVLGDRCLISILEKSDSNKTKLVEYFEEDEDCQEAIKYIDALKDLFKCSLCCVVIRKSIIRWNNYILSQTIHTTQNTLNTSTTINTLNTLNTLHTLNTLNTPNNFYNKIKESNIYGRDLELSFPLLIIAYLISEEVFDNLLSNFTIYVREKFEEQVVESNDTALIDFISKEEETNNFVPISSLVKKFKEFLMGDEENTDELLWLNSKWLGRAIKRNKLIIDKRRVNRGIEVRLNYKKAREKIKMYKPMQPMNQETKEKENQIGEITENKKENSNFEDGVDVIKIGSEEDVTNV